jgi:translation initiation factor 2B subunit (eIF-2B alpha/beta/delta family)
LKKGIRIATIAILAIILVSTGSVSAMFYGQSPERRAERIYEIADSAGQRVADLIDLVYVNETVLELIENATLLEALENNVTRYNEGMQNVTNAYDALEAEDYEGAIANATQALHIFREVLRSIHVILRDSEVQRGQIVDAQGLLVAMERALERIERLRDLLPENATVALALLDEATNHLDIDEARLWLLDGNVTETAHNLTQANQLIAQVHQLLRDQAKRLNTWRINNFLRGIHRTRERLRVRFWAAYHEGVDVDAVLEDLGYQNMTDFTQTIQNKTESALEKIEDIKDAIQDLKEVGRILREMDHSLAKEIWRHRTQHGFGAWKQR